MKVCYLGPGAYAGRVPHAGWPVPPELCDREVASSSLNAVLNQFQLADELGFDWISVSEHHYAPRLMTPNPVVLAAAQGGGNPGVGGFQFYGHPRTILGQVREFHEAGVGVLDIAFAPDAYGRGGTFKAMEAFASVLPEIQRLNHRALEDRS